MNRVAWVKTAVSYFAVVFGVGFVLGILRVLVLVPRIGVRTAELLEMPLMILATVFAARWAVLCFKGMPARRAPLRTGLTALSLLVFVEMGLGRMNGLSPMDYFLNRDPIAGPAYFVALALFGVMPLLVVRGLDRAGETPGLIDGYVQLPDVVENYETIVHAPANAVFRVAEHFDLLSVPIVRSIFRLRELAFGLPGNERKAPGSLVSETMELGWRMLSYRTGRGLIMGAATQPWVGDVKFRGIEPAAFSGFAEPDLVKIVWTLEAEPIGVETTRFRSQTRVLATDDEARRKFLRYWVFAGVFVGMIRRLANRAIRRTAERQAAAH